MVAPWHFAVLAALAGAPTAGSLFGAFAGTPTWAAVVFGYAAGAIARVIWTVGLGLSVIAPGPALAAGFAAGVFVMYATGLLTA
ncbi:MAG: hypothetical protein ACRDY6_18800 [Acidimicrobiia bacterium]